jgi:hypothetical protein
MRRTGMRLLKRLLLLVAFILLIQEKNASAQVREANPGPAEQNLITLFISGSIQRLRLEELTPTSPEVKPSSPGLFTGSVVLRSAAAVLVAGFAIWSLARVLGGPSGLLTAILGYEVLSVFGFGFEAGSEAGAIGETAL